MVKRVAENIPKLVKCSKCTTFVSLDIDAQIRHNNLYHPVRKFTKKGKTDGRI